MSLGHTAQPTREIVRRNDKRSAECVAISVIEPYGQRKHVITSAFGVQWSFLQLNGLVNK